MKPFFQFTTHDARRLRKRNPDHERENGPDPRLEDYNCEGGTAVIYCSTAEREQFHEGTEHASSFDSDTLAPDDFGRFANWLTREHALRLDHAGTKPGDPTECARLTLALPNVQKALAAYDSAKWADVAARDAGIVARRILT